MVSIAVLSTHALVLEDVLVAFGGIVVEVELIPVLLNGSEAPLPQPTSRTAADKHADTTRVFRSIV
jgi:hypothetical protein